MIPLNTHAISLSDFCAIAARLRYIQRWQWSLELRNSLDLLMRKLFLETIHETVAEAAVFFCHRCAILEDIPWPALSWINSTSISQSLLFCCSFLGYYFLLYGQSLASSRITTGKTTVRARLKWSKWHSSISSGRQYYSLLSECLRLCIWFLSTNQSWSKLIKMKRCFAWYIDTGLCFFLTFLHSYFRSRSPFYCSFF